jgi:hypothetical protein
MGRREQRTEPLTTDCLPEGKAVADAIIVIKALRRHTCAIAINVTSGIWLSVMRSLDI